MLKDSLQHSYRSAFSTRDLRQAILKTVAYSDIFGYPLSSKEIHRYLIGIRVPFTELSQILNSMDSLATRTKFYSLPGRSSLVALRLYRTKISSSLWGQAFRFGRIISNLPFVKMVAVTGALAMNNVESDADVDYMIVTKPGRVWTVRAMILGLERIKVAGATICPNYLLSEDALSLDDNDLFTAQELVRMVPLSGLTTYQRMRAENIWTNNYLPNAVGSPIQSEKFSKSNITLKTFGETILNTSPLNRIEQWEMKRKITMLTRNHVASNGEFGTEARFGPDWCKGHFDAHGAKTMAAFQLRLSKLDISLDA